MPYLRFDRTDFANVQIRWETPGGAGGTRTAFVTLRSHGGPWPLTVGYGFSVAIPDDGNGREEALRLQAYRLILPAVSRLARRLGRDPVTAAQVARFTNGRRADIHFAVASDDGARRAFCDANVRIRPDATDEDLVLQVSGIAFRLVDALAQDLQSLVGPDL